MKLSDSDDFHDEQWCNDKDQYHARQWKNYFEGFFQMWLKFDHKQEIWINLDIFHRYAESNDRVYKNI